MSAAMTKKRESTNSDGGKGKRDRKSAPIQVDKEIARRVAVIATHMGITQSEFVTPYIRQYVNTHYRKVVSEMGDEAEGLDDQPE